ncbi:SHOCT domain-containing protein [Oryzomonas rubra]|nr:SHOCT domain-containing protein [Oryzomonas rubra]
MWIFPLLGLFIFLVVMIAVFCRGCFRPLWHSSGVHSHEESALEILKKRYAKGELSKEQFEQMKMDIL